MDMHLGRRHFLISSGVALAAVAHGDKVLAAPGIAAAQPRALACTWGGYVDTDLNFTEFFNGNHTVAVRFMLQFPNAYLGPMLSVRGSGTYHIGQGDFLASPTGTKLVVRIGSQAITHQVNLAAGTWHHLAVVRSGSTVRLYLDGAQVGGTLTVPTTGLPQGTLRLGKTNDATVAGGVQFYGLLDDAAVFTTALTATQVAQLAAAGQLSGSEAGLLAGYVFDDGALPAKLSRPITRTAAAFLRPVSANRSNAADAAQLPLALTGHKHLPIPAGQAWFVIQGVDDAGGSHKGYASFCWDLMLAGQPQSASRNKPFHAAAPGTVVFVKEDAAPGGATNFITVAEEPGEFGDYLHLIQNSAIVAANDRVNDGQHMANVGDTGAAVGAYHLHFATTNLGESRTSGTFVTIPAPFSNYEASDNQGVTWYRVLRGIPRAGQWVRRAGPSSPARYTAVWRRSTEGEIQVYGWTYEDFRAKYDELWPQGWRLKHINPHVVNGQVRYTAVWRPSTEGEIQVYGWTYEDFRAKYDELWPQGWRLKFIAPYVVNGEVRYTAVWRPSTEGEVQVYGWTYEDFRAKYDELWPQGWRLKFIAPYVVNGEVRYTAVWRPSTEGEVQVYGWTYEDFRAKYDELWPQGWRLKFIAPYVVNGAVRYTAVWRPSSVSEIQVYGWTHEDLRARYDVLWELGWRLALLAPYA